MSESQVAAYQFWYNQINTWNVEHVLKQSDPSVIAELRTEFEQMVSLLQTVENENK